MEDNYLLMSRVGMSITIGVACRATLDSLPTTAVYLPQLSLDSRFHVLTTVPGVCSSNYTIISTHRQPASPVPALILHPREIHVMCSQNHDKVIRRCNAHAITIMAFQRYDLLVQAIQMVLSNGS